MVEDFKSLINMTSQNMNSCELNFYVLFISDDENSPSAGLCLFVGLYCLKLFAI